MDIRQSLFWGNYLSQIGWKIEKIGQLQAFIRPLPFLRCSLIKIQRPKNPVDFTAVDLLAKKHRALFVLIEPEIESYYSQDFLKNGYQKSFISLTYTANLRLNLNSTTENILASFSENARRNIKKSQSKLSTQIISLKNIEPEEDFQTFFNLLTTLTKLKKFIVPGYQELYQKMLAFKKNSYLLFAYKKGQSQPLAALWIFTFEKKMYYLHTGITQEGYDLLANYLLVWEAVKKAKELNLEIFDFEGIYDQRFPKERKKWVNFTQFKKRFHGDVVEYPEPWIKCYHLLFKFFYLCNKVLSL
ncbi:MAG: peptidoglycan bridge formation glycyltransferase FemA/FemB family protein [Patescibacteria group bacterium]|nr:peptidoglycan bridge formation glycyltransferase FemA/FemB family protein [Patescibacteria group bacterium]